MSRTFHGLLHAMEKLTKGIPEALCLVRGLKKRAVALKWDPKVEFDPENGVRIKIETRLRDPVFIIFLPRDSRAPTNDALVWESDVRFGGCDDTAPGLFVDAVACHDDWLALKAIYEFGVVELAERMCDLEYTLRLKCELPDDVADSVFKQTSQRLRSHHDVLISRIVDRRLDGRIKDHVEAIKESSERIIDGHAFASKFLKHIAQLLPQRWPASANNEERYARYELLKCVVRGFVDSDILGEVILN